MRYFNLKLALFGALFVILCVKGVDVVSSRGVLSLPGNASAVAGVEEPGRQPVAKQVPPAPAPYDELKALSPRPDIAERTLPTKSTTIKARKNIAHSAASVKKNTAPSQAKRAGNKS
jgi:hypothetical protein